jgi:pSer/pThr/pTyr-binding forkhead associated (FHA) protein
MTELVIQSGKHKGKMLVLPDDDVVVGRDENCQIRLATSEVSRQHCLLRLSSEGLVVRDMGSRNGTFVNDVAIAEETLLKPGDVLRVGPLALQVPHKRKRGDNSGATHPTLTLPKTTTDDDIAGWLSGVEGEQNAVGDTTIIPREPKTEVPSMVSDLPKQKFKTVADEAKDIIRRHWEMQQEAQEG